VRSNIANQQKWLVQDKQELFIIIQSQMDIEREETDLTAASLPFIYLK